MFYPLKESIYLRTQNFSSNKTCYNNNLCCFVSHVDHFKKTLFDKVKYLLPILGYRIKIKSSSTLYRGLPSGVILIFVIVQ